MRLCSLVMLCCLSAPMCCLVAHANPPSARDSVRAVGPSQATNPHVLGADGQAENLPEGPLRTSPAAEDVEAERAVLGERVTRQM